MEIEDLRQSLEEASGQVLEEAAFIFTEPLEEDDEAPAFGEDAFRATLAFSGPKGGRFSITAKKGMCAFLAGELIGAQPDDPEAEQRAADVLGEVLNMTAGMTLSMVYDHEQVWELGVPTVKPLDNGQDEEEAKATCSVNLMTEEEDPIRVSAFLEEAGS